MNLIKLNHIYKAKDKDKLREKADYKKVLNSLKILY
jgi:hypothetical protein